MKPKLSQGAFVVEVNPYHVHPRAVLSHQTILSWAQTPAAPGSVDGPAAKQLLSACGICYLLFPS